MYEALGDSRLRTRVEFRYADPAEDHPSLWITPQRLAERDIAFAYVDSATCAPVDVLNLLAGQLGTAHSPYAIAESGWVRFIDDLMTLAYNRAGLVIVVDNAADLFAAGPSWGFDLLKWWTTQLWHWAEQGRPCQLCFQMDRSLPVQRVYAPTL